MAEFAELKLMECWRSLALTFAALMIGHPRLDRDGEEHLGRLLIAWLIFRPDRRRGGAPHGTCGRCVLVMSLSGHDPRRP